MTTTTTNLTNNQLHLLGMTVAHGGVPDLAEIANVGRLWGEVGSLQANQVEQDIAAATAEAERLNAAGLRHMVVGSFSFWGLPGVYVWPGTGEPTPVHPWRPQGYHPRWAEATDTLPIWAAPDEAAWAAGDLSADVPERTHAHAALKRIGDAAEHAYKAGDWATFETLLSWAVQAHNLAEGRDADAPINTGGRLEVSRRCGLLVVSGRHTDGRPYSAEHIDAFLGGYAKFAHYNEPIGQWVRTGRFPEPRGYTQALAGVLELDLSDTAPLARAWREINYRLAGLSTEQRSEVAARLLAITGESYAIT